MRQDPHLASRVTGDAFVPVARVAELPPGTLRSVCLPNGEQVVLMNVDGEICALADMCSHESYALSAGELLPDGTIECVWHGARFDCRTGAARHPPAIDGVPVYLVRTEGGTVVVGPHGSRG